MEFRDSAVQMADDVDNQLPSLSVIPYDNNRDIVLRHADAIVYLDPQTKQLTTFTASAGVEARSHQRHDCPTCGRPLQTRAGSSGQDAGPSSSDEEPSFITPDYFQMLARSLPGSGQNSAPPSPRRRIVQPVRSRLGSPPLSQVTPPPEAEFVGSSPAPPSPAHGISETAFAPQYFEKFFSVERELGRGGRGVVLLVKHTLDGVSLGYFACKRVPIGDDHSWLEKVLVEVQLLQTLSHQNLVSYRHVWLQDYQINTFGPSVPCAFILQQYCNGGDLHNYVCGAAQATTTTEQLKERIRRRSKGESELPRRSNEAKRLHFEEIYSFFRDITAGIRFLHLNGFIHRDLKPSNCLLHTTGSETRVLVSDFGEVQYEYATRKSTGATGTISYCAPEVLTRVLPEGPFGNFSFKSDIFSLGMILHFLCFANLPYHSANVLHEEREDVEKLRVEIVGWGGFDDHRKLRPELPSELYAFLKRLLSLNPENRPSADEVEHGISTGRLEALSGSRRRNSAVPEELTPGKRIEKLDTPARGNSPQSGLGLEIAGKKRRSAHYTIRPRSRERRKSETDPVDFSASADDSAANESEEQIQSSRAGSRHQQRNSTSIILRSKHSVSLPSSPTKERKSFNSPERPQGLLQQQLLLPPPSASEQMTFSHRLRKSLIDAQISLTSLRVMILVLKLFSTLQPCLSRGMNAAIVYPLITYAVVEFALPPPYHVWRAVLGMVGHLLILAVAMRTDNLCASVMIRWNA